MLRTVGRRASPREDVISYLLQSSAPQFSDEQVQSMTLNVILGAADTTSALAAHTIELVDHVNEVFSDENVNALRETLDNARLASKGLPETVRDVKQLVADMRSASHEVESAAADLRVRSVVRIAAANRSACSALFPRSAAAPRMPRVSFSIGSR